MIVEVKVLLEEVIRARIPNVHIARSFAEESQAVMGRTWPLVALISNPGDFDNTAARTVKWFDATTGYWLQRYVRGERVLPVLIRCWDAGEAACDALLSAIVPYIPSRWTLDGFEGSITIGAEEHSDHTGNATKLYTSIIEVTCTVPVAQASVRVPTIDGITIDPSAI